MYIHPSSTPPRRGGRYGRFRVPEAGWRGLGLGRGRGPAEVSHPIRAHPPGWDLPPKLSASCFVFAFWLARRLLPSRPDEGLAWCLLIERSPPICLFVSEKSARTTAYSGLMLIFRSGLWKMASTCSVRHSRDMARCRLVAPCSWTADVHVAQKSVRSLALSVLPRLKEEASCVRIDSRRQPVI